MTLDTSTVAELCDVGGTLMANGHELKIAGLLQNGDPKKIFALAWKTDADIPEKSKVFLPRDGEPVGTIQPFRALAENGENIGVLFAVVEFNEGMAKVLTSRAHQVAVTKDVYANIFGPGTMRVRKLFEASKRKVFDGRGSNRNACRHPRPRLVGDVWNPAFELDKKEFRVERLAIAKSRDPFASDHDVGQPIISDKDALLGFIVLADPDATFILPAEDIEKNLGVKFMSVSANVIRPHGAPAPKHRKRWLNPPHHL